MPNTTTDKVELVKPQIGGANSTWGNLLNEDMDTLENWLVEDRAAILSSMQSGRADPAATIKLDSEHDAHRWISASDAPNQFMWPSEAPLIEQIQSKILQESAARPHLRIK